jgi:putative hydrolase of the HAD superfamily
MESDNRTRPQPTAIEALARVQGIIFDVDGTLYDQSALRRRIASRMVAAHWTKPSNGVRVIRALRAYRQAHEELRGHAFSAELQLAAAAAKCGYTVDEVCLTVEQWFERTPLALLRGCAYPGIPQFLHLLSEHRIVCGVFSDYPAEAKLTALGLRGFFDHILCAADVGRQKPDPLGLLAVAREMGVAPSRALYVGDRAIDLQAATRAGMQGMLVESKNSYSVLNKRVAIPRRQQPS